MEIILLERVEKLGQMGDVVRVKPGYARNFLLPRGKALRATDGNKARFEAERAQLEARNLERKQEAERVAKDLEGKAFVVIRQAGESGQLYGSVSTRDIAELVSQSGVSVDRGQVELKTPIKELGMHSVQIDLHPEVVVTIQANVARTEEEAERQARGEDVTARRDEEEEALDDLEAMDVDEMFEEGVAPESDTAGDGETDEARSEDRV